MRALDAEFAGGCLPLAPSVSHSESSLCLACSHKRTALLATQLMAAGDDRKIARGSLGVHQ